MSAIIKFPGDLMQEDVQSGLVKLDEFHKNISSLDSAFNGVDIRAAYNSTPDTRRVAETIEAIRIRLASLLQKFQFKEEPGYRDHAVRFSNDGKMEKADQQKRIGYHDLRKFLQYHEVEMPLYADSLRTWQDLQIKKIPGWFDRIITRRQEIQPGNDLDMHVDLCENALRGIPAYGKEFEIDRNTITYNGNLQALLNAFKRDRLKGIIVETYPGNLKQQNINAPTWVGLLDMIGNRDILLRYHDGCMRLWYYNFAGGNVLTNYNPVTASSVSQSITVGSSKMHERVGIAQLRFLFEILNPKDELSIDSQVSNRGAQYPTLTELLFYGFGHNDPKMFPALDRGNCYYKIANEFNHEVYPETPAAYVCVGREYDKDGKRQKTELFFTSDIIGKKYRYNKYPIAMYVL